MKRLIFVVTGVLLAMVVLSVGCTKATPAPAAPSEKMPVTGNLTGINTPADPVTNAITVLTPQGIRVIPITPDTTYSLDGKSCTIDELNKVLLSGNASYNCIVVEKEDCADNINIWRIVP